MTLNKKIARFRIGVWLRHIQNIASYVEPSWKILRHDVFTQRMISSNIVTFICINIYGSIGWCSDARDIIVFCLSAKSSALVRIKRNQRVFRLIFTCGSSFVVHCQVDLTAFCFNGSRTFTFIDRSSR
ncbi:hypothetical protein ACHAXS_013274, partial [Conticribra weissflogii]